MRVVRLSASVCIEAQAVEAWTHLVRLEDIALWSEAVVHASCEGEQTQGVGAERTCRLVGGMTIHQQFTAWDDGRSLTYESAGIPFLARAQNTWTVHAEGDRALLTSDAEVAMRGGFAGRLLEPAVAFQARRAGTRALAAFKYLVERGAPRPPPSARSSRKTPPSAERSRMRRLDDREPTARIGRRFRRIRTPDREVSHVVPRVVRACRRSTLGP